MYNSNRSVSQYYVKTSTDNNKFIAIQEGGGIKVINIMLGKNPIQARTSAVISPKCLVSHVVMWTHANIIIL